MTRIAQELGQKGLISKDEAVSVAEKVNEIYSQDADVRFTMPISYTIGTVPS